MQKAIRNAKTKLKPLFDTTKRVCRGILTLALLIGMLYTFWWIGFKGMMGVTMGMGLMAYLILSKNAVLMYLIKSTEAETYVDEINRK